MPLFHLTTLAGLGFIVCGCSSPADTAALPVPPIEQAPPGEVSAPEATSESASPDGDAQGEFQSTASGLKYAIRREGSGRKPTASDSVTVHYRGWLDDGTEFDSSYDRGEPTTFPLNGVIPGWTEGIQLVAEGGEIELDIPSELGYGSRGTPGGPIPPDARLHFTVELLKIR